MALHDCRLCCYRLRRVCVRARFGASGLTIKQAELWEFGGTVGPLRKGRERYGLAMCVWGPRLRGNAAPGLRFANPGYKMWRLLHAFKTLHHG
jgi:hypothetical protein